MLRGTLEYLKPGGGAARKGDVLDDSFTHDESENSINRHVGQPDIASLMLQLWVKTIDNKTLNRKSVSIA